MVDLNGVRDRDAHIPPFRFDRLNPESLPEAPLNACMSRQ